MIHKKLQIDLSNNIYAFNHLVNTMKKIAILFLSLFFVLPSHSNPMNEGTEYKCITVALHRIDGEKMDEFPVSVNEKPIYIKLKADILSASFKIMNAPEAADNNARLIKARIEEYGGGRFDTLTFIKNRNDGVSTILIFKDLNINDQTLTLTSRSEYTGYSAMIRVISRCSIE